MTIQKKWNFWKIPKSYTRTEIVFLRNTSCFKKYILLILVDILCFPCPYQLTMSTKSEINISTI